MKQAGILCPVFSLPGDYGIGDLGTAAYRFLDILSRTDFQIWQVLPLNPIGFGHSPYQPLSSFAGETVYIDLSLLQKDGLIAKVAEPFGKMPERVDYEAAAAFKKPYFEEAFASFRRLLAPPADFMQFTKEAWVLPYGLFAALRKKNGKMPWTEWPAEEKRLFERPSGEAENEEQLCGRKIAEANGCAHPSEKETSIAGLWDTLPEKVKYDAEYEIFLQYEFRKQWLGVLDYAHALSIRIMGDIPIYVGGDSLDVLCDRDEFLLDPDGYPTSVAGVPPDCFSETGQRWGNPIYDWEKMEKNGFAFWKERLRGTARLYDMIRIDHFLAFHAFWKIPATCETAVDGAWTPGPGAAFFDAVLPEISGTQIVAEDLGLIRPEVYELRDKYHFPGMNVLLFTLGDGGFRLKESMVTYTGTHDNMTVNAHYDTFSDWERERFDRGLRSAGIREEGTKALQTIEYAFRLGTDYVILNIGDVLEQGEEGRINEPGTVNLRNWTYRLENLETVAGRCAAIKALREKIAAEQR